MHSEVEDYDDDPHCYENDVMNNWWNAPDIIDAMKPAFYFNIKAWEK